MSGIVAGLAISGGVAAYQISNAEKQKNQAKKLRDSLVDPNYTKPKSIEENLVLAKSMAKEGMSAEEESQRMDAINSNAANTITNFRGRKGALVGAEAVGEQVRKSNSELRLEDTRQRLANVKQLMIANQVDADYDDKAFQLNVLDPYARDYNRASSLESASAQNKNNALNSFAQSANSAGQAYASTQ